MSAARLQRAASSADRTAVSGSLTDSRPPTHTPTTASLETPNPVRAAARSSRLAGCSEVTPFRISTARRAARGPAAASTSSYSVWETQIVLVAARMIARRFACAAALRAPESLRTRLIPWSVTTDGRKARLGRQIVLANLAVHVQHVAGTRGPRNAGAAAQYRT